MLAPTSELSCFAILCSLFSKCFPLPSSPLSLNVLHLASNIRYAYHFRSSSAPWRKRVRHQIVKTGKKNQDYLSVNNIHLLMSAQSMCNEPALTQNTYSITYFFTPHFHSCPTQAAWCWWSMSWVTQSALNIFPLISEQCLFLPSHYSSVCSVNSRQDLKSSNTSLCLSRADELLLK